MELAILKQRANKVILTFDIEGWPPREDYFDEASRVCLTMTLNLLEDEGFRGIFFVTGSVAEKLREYPNIIEKLTTPTELSGFLNWALEGLERLLKNKNFTGLKPLEQRKEIWLIGSSSLYKFVSVCVEEDDGWSETSIASERTLGAPLFAVNVNPDKLSSRYPDDRRGETHVTRERTSNQLLH